MFRIFALLLAAVAMSGLARAQEETDPPKEAGPAPTFKELLKQRSEFESKIGTLREEFQSAEPQRQAAIEKEYQALVQNYLTRLSPAIGKAAMEVYAKDGENEAAKRAVEGFLAESLSMNKFTEVANHVKALMDAGRKNPALYTMGGVARFNVHEFVGAKQLLSAAKEADEGGMPQDAQQFLALADEYAGFWKEEQALRAKADKAGDLPRVLFSTSKGDIELELFENEAPNTVANFITLVEKKFYDGTRFHRVIGNFMVQGGDPNSKNKDPSDDGQGGPGYNIPCETNTKTARRHFRGSLAMAHSGKDTGGSQFFITHRPTPHLNSGWINPLTGKPDVNPQTGQPNAPHTVFGRVVSGLDVVMKIQGGDLIKTATVTRKREHEYKAKTLAEKPRTRRAPPPGEEQ